MLRSFQYFVLVLLLASCNKVSLPANSDCTLDGDCTLGERCDNGVCISGRTVSADCTEDSEIEDCGVGAFCNENRLCTTIPPCDQGCPLGFECNVSLDRCVRIGPCGPGCPDDSFCNGVEICDKTSLECIAGIPPCGGSTPLCSEDDRACLCSGDTDCVLPNTCNDGQCNCTPQCDGRECGGDGCGGNCGACNGSECDEATGTCSCIPQCDGRTCGPDGCDGSCAPGCTAPDTCDNGDCTCSPNCGTERECGDDGCGGTCGTCDNGSLCAANGTCGCIPQCTGRECGPDACGGFCGTCTGAAACSAAGQCDCIPQCTGRECGDNSCGGTCGSGCAANQECNIGGHCENTGVICDVLTDTITLAEFDSVTFGSLTPGTDAAYSFDGVAERIVDDFTLSAPGPDGEPGSSPVPLVISVNADVPAGFDPVLYIVRISAGTCDIIGKNDAPGDVFLQLTNMQATATYKAVVTSTAPGATGSYDIFTSVQLCGKSFANQSAYDSCAERIRLNNFDCGNNPCVAGTAPEFCCVNNNPDAECPAEITVLPAASCGN